jgi:hypothetical protein
MISLAGKMRARLADQSYEISSSWVCWGEKIAWAGPWLVLCDILSNKNKHVFCITNFSHFFSI